jgi:hypothetical protein
MVGMHLMLYALCCMAERTGSMHADQMNKPIERLLGQKYHEGALHGRHLSMIGMHRCIQVVAWSNCSYTVWAFVTMVDVACNTLSVTTCLFKGCATSDKACWIAYQ